MRNPIRTYFHLGLYLSYLVCVASDDCRAQEVNIDRKTDRIEATQLRFGLDANQPLIERVGKTPDSVLAIFHEAGMSPKPYTLNEQDQQRLVEAISILPPIHQSVLKQRLRRISLVTDMPNTALTSAVNPDEPNCLFDITIRAGILSQSAAEWLVEKESSCFNAEKSSIHLKADVGNITALQYVFLHEATHVVDATLQVTPSSHENRGSVLMEHATPFTANVWEDARTPAARYKDEGLMAITFRPGGKAQEATKMKELYEALGRTPFVSLYGSAARTEDLAEYTTVYHLTQRLQQPYRIHVYDGNNLIFTHDPMASEITRGRFELMKQFYQSENVDESSGKNSTGD